ncbi:hypothetical protein OE88DRAFT_1666285 [Heliocybe sulcata]|uniref:Uncharacterized protein n=1 Tax=Heliocybe sulcata TaxID=5364 RepID=A0A5C3MR41_9AGAM|nr:hypothetical protein OE88DRAFT_1666285 [Heliocybe sulcata]
MYFVLIYDTLPILTSSPHLPTFVTAPRHKQGSCYPVEPGSPTDRLPFSLRKKSCTLDLIQSTDSRGPSSAIARPTSCPLPVSNVARLSVPTHTKRQTTCDGEAASRSASHVYPDQYSPRPLYQRLFDHRRPSCVLCSILTLVGTSAANVSVPALPKYM